MAKKKGIYVVSACQNTYQEKRVIKFAQNLAEGKVDFFNFHYDFPLKLGIGNKIEERLEVKQNLEKIAKSSEIWIIQGSMGCPPMSLEDGGDNYRLLGICLVEYVAKKIKRKIRYFKIAQTGRTIGQGIEVERKAIFSSKFLSKKGFRDPVDRELFNELKKEYGIK